MYSGLKVAVVPWVVARVAVGGALVVAHVLRDEIPRLHHNTPYHVYQGLLGWDAAWYHRIALHGYSARRLVGVRFFPLYPMLGRGLGWLLGGRPGIALVLVANAAALAAAAIVHQLALRETGDARLARRAAWLVALVPPGYVLVMGYSEGLALLLSAAGFLALRRRRFGPAAVWGLLSGLTRPTGALMALPALIEAVRSEDRRRDLPAKAAAVAAPVAGCGLYLAWVGVRFHHPMLPLQIQQRPEFRGPLANPLIVLAKAANQALHGDWTGNAAHLPWAVILIVLAVVACRRWPASYGAFAAATIVMALSTNRLGSLERYGFLAVPTILAAATAIGDGDRESAILAVAGAWLLGYAAMTFIGFSVP